jgi:hypothetical protein
MLVREQKCGKKTKLETATSTLLETDDLENYLKFTIKYFP